MAPNGPPDDFHNQQTQYRDYGGPPARPGGTPPNAPPPAGPPTEEAWPAESRDPFDEETEPTPWYRRPAGIIAGVLAVLVLIALIVYGLMELIGGDQGTGHTPSTSTTAPSTTSTTSTTVPPTTTTTAEPSTTTEAPTSSAAEPPAQQPTHQPTRQPTQQPPTHRHHLPQLPSVITIPEVPTVITLPPGLS